jgi:SM-20-related protein
MNLVQDVQNIDVEVTLTGGLSYSSVLPSNSPILHDLYSALAAAHQPESQQPGILLQLPLDGGKTACSFMSTSVISVATSPPVLIQPQPFNLMQNQIAPATARDTYVRIDDFLTPDENGKLFKYALKNEEEFTGSSVTTNADDYRRSSVLYAIQESKWRDIFLERLMLHLPHIMATLNIADFPIERSEIQLTVSNDGDFFKAHPDSAEAEETESRVVTFVYYLNRVPKRYSGGNLLLYSGRPGQVEFDCGRDVTSVEPVNNCLVAFASSRWHEVDMVRCPSGEFRDGRFTINGWLHRQL